MAIGRQVNECFTNTPKAPDEEGRALMPDPDDPAAIHRHRDALSGTIGEWPRSIGSSTRSAGRWMDGNVPYEITNEFAAYRVSLEQAR